MTQRLGPLRSTLLALLLAVGLVVAGCDTGMGSGSDGGSAGKTRLSGFSDCPAPLASDSRVNPSNPLPALKLPCMDGSGRDFSFRAPTGVPMVINVWGSWCPPCGKELPVFAYLAARSNRSGGDRQLAVLGVVTQDNAQNAVRAAHELGVHFPNVYDRAGAFQHALGRSALPLTVFVAADGSVVHVYNGPPLTDESLQALVRERLGVTL